MKQLALLLLSFYLFGCSNRKENRDNDLEQSLIETSSFMKVYNENIWFKFEKALAENPSKIKPYYDKVKSFHEKINLLTEDLQKFYTDSLGSVKIEQLIERYNDLIDTLKMNVTPPYLKGLYKNDTIIQKDYLAFKSKQSDKLIALEIIENIIENEIKAKINILREKYDTKCGFEIETIACEELESKKQGGYAFGLQGSFNPYKGIQHIYIDTILYNGKSIQKKYFTKLNTCFANINFDSLSNGNYMVKGTIEQRSAWGVDYYYTPFLHHFEIKK